MTKFQIFAVLSPAIVVAVMWVQGSLETYFHSRESSKERKQLHAAE